MKISNFKVLSILCAMVLCIVTFSSCSDDDDDNNDVNITVNEGPNGDIGGDFTGQGGDGQRSINWNNGLATADYNADITAPAPGTFQMIVEDADGNVVLDRTINGGSEPDSIDGVTSAGTPGEWTVTIILTSFNGDGSYSLSEGD